MKKIICEYCNGTGKLGFQQETCWFCQGNGFREVKETSGIFKEKETSKESSGIFPNGYKYVLTFKIEVV